MLNTVLNTVLIISESVSIAESLQKFVFRGLNYPVSGIAHPSDNLDDWISRTCPDIVIFYTASLSDERIRALSAALLAGQKHGNTMPKFLVIAERADIHDIQRALSLGTHGFLVHLPMREVLLDAIEKVQRGEQVVSGVGHSAQELAVLKMLGVSTIHSKR